MNRLHTFGVMCVIGAAGSVAGGQVLGQHHLTWWDDAQLGLFVTPVGAPAPTPAAIALFNMDEWHIDQATTASWYNGVAVPGLPVNPFSAANRNGMTAGSVIVPVAAAEGFIYQITNLNYFNGNGPPPFQAPPFSFTMAPGMLGQNDLSGINIQDTHGALATSAPAVGSQFMFSSNLVVGSILDLTPASLGVPASQDWDFNAHTGPGNFEWDIDTAGVGASPGLAPIVFGYAMPGNWLDSTSTGHVHSWSFPAGAAPFQVNVALQAGGFSGPKPIPAPGVLVMAAAGVAALRRRR